MIIGKRRMRAKRLEIGTPTSSRRHLRQQLQHIRTLVVDSSSLIKDTYQFDSAWSSHMDKNEVVTATYNALIATDELKLRSLRNNLPPSKDAAHAPISGDYQTLSWSTWHHGSDYKTFWFGDITSMLHHADITDTEREELTLRARRAISRGLIAYAVGSSLTPSLPARPDHDIEQLGLIFMKPIVYPGTETALRQIKSHGIDILYISSDDTYTTTAVAHVTGLAEKDEIAVALTARRLPTMHCRLYAGSTPILYRRLIAPYPTGSLATVNVPLPEFWRDFMATLS